MRNCLADVVDRVGGSGIRGAAVRLVDATVIYIRCLLHAWIQHLCIAGASHCRILETRTCAEPKSDHAYGVFSCLWLSFLLPALCMNRFYVHGLICNCRRGRRPVRHRTISALSWCFFARTALPFSEKQKAKKFCCRVYLVQRREV